MISSSVLELGRVWTENITIFDKLIGLIYLAVLILLLIPAIRYDFLNKKGGEKVWYYVNLLILILLAGLRYRVGGDTGHYMQTFNDMPTLTELSTFNFSKAYYMPLWYVYNAIFRSFGGYYLFQIVQAIIINTAFLWFFKKYCPHFFSAIVVYFLAYYFSLNMDIMRQALCICIFLFSYGYLKEKKLLQYYILSIIAIGFHMSAIFLLIVPLIRLSRKWFIIIIVALLSVILMIRLENNLEGIVTLVSKSGVDAWKYYIIDRLHYYIDSSHLNIIGMAVRFMLCMPFIIMLIVKWFFLKKEDKLIDNLMLLLVSVQISSLMFPAFGRFNYYLFPIGIVFIIKEISENYQAIRTSKMASLLVIVALLVYCVNISYSYIMNQHDYKEGAHVYHRYLPYHSVINPVEDEFREDYLRHIHGK